MTEKKITIPPAKGRPLLRWVGKKPVDVIISALPQQSAIGDGRPGRKLVNM